MVAHGGHAMKKSGVVGACCLRARRRLTPRGRQDQANRGRDAIREAKVVRTQVIVCVARTKKMPGNLVQ